MQMMTPILLQRLRGRDIDIIIRVLLPVLGMRVRGLVV